jgi:2,4-dienoyl-CoA reductase-like NADH-dependent reductase (Old Yellow Enzyme family)
MGNPFNRQMGHVPLAGAAVTDIGFGGVTAAYFPSPVETLPVVPLTVQPPIAENGAGDLTPAEIGSTREAFRTAARDAQAQGYLGLGRKRR